MACNDMEIDLEISVLVTFILLQIRITKKMKQSF